MALPKPRGYDEWEAGNSESVESPSFASFLPSEGTYTNPIITGRPKESTSFRDVFGSLTQVPTTDREVHKSNVVASERLRKSLGLDTAEYAKFEAELEMNRMEKSGELATLVADIDYGPVLNELQAFNRGFFRAAERTIPGLGRGIGALLNSDTMKDYYDGVIDHRNKTGMYKKKSSEKASTGEKVASFAGEAAWAGLESAALMISGGEAGLTILAAMTGSEKMAESKDQGYDYFQSLLRGVAKGLLTYTVERHLPYDAWLDSTSSLWRAAIGEGLEELTEGVYDAFESTFHQSIAEGKPIDEAGFDALKAEMDWRMHVGNFVGGSIGAAAGFGVGNRPSSAYVKLHRAVKDIEKAGVKLEGKDTIEKAKSLFAIQESGLDEESKKKALAAFTESGTLETDDSMTKLHEFVDDSGVQETFKDGDTLKKMLMKRGIGDNLFADYGLQDLIDSEKPVTKQELADKVQESNLDYFVFQLDPKSEYGPAAFEHIGRQFPRGEKYREILVVPKNMKESVDSAVKLRALTKEDARLNFSINALNRKVSNISDGLLDESLSVQDKSSKHFSGRYTTMQKDLVNTQEILESKRAEQDNVSAMMNEEANRYNALTNESFKKSHWKERAPNLILNIRASETVGKDGQKILLIEEVQSDWDSQARKYGSTAEEQSNKRKVIAKNIRAAIGPIANSVSEKYGLDAGKIYDLAELSILGTEENMLGSSELYREVSNLLSELTTDVEAEAREELFKILNPRYMDKNLRDLYQRYQDAAPNTEGKYDKFVPLMPNRAEWTQTAAKVIARYARGSQYNIVTFAKPEHIAATYMGHGREKFEKVYTDRLFRHMSKIGGETIKGDIDVPSSLTPKERRDQIDTLTDVISFGTDSRNVIPSNVAGVQYYDIVEDPDLPPGAEGNTIAHVQRDTVGGDVRYRFFNFTGLDTGMENETLVSAEEFKGFLDGNASVDMMNLLKSYVGSHIDAKQETAVSWDTTQSYTVQDKWIDYMSSIPYRGLQTRSDIPKASINRQIVGDGEDIRAVAKADPRMAQVLAKNLYKEKTDVVIIKELLQNAKDAVMDMSDPSKGEVTFDINTENKTIKIEDNGAGMTPSIAHNQLIDFGGSYKSEGSSGGFGLAKFAIFGNSKNITITTTAKVENDYVTTVLTGSGRDWIDTNKGLKTETFKNIASRTGTSLELELYSKEEGGIEQFREHRIYGFLTAFLSNTTAPFKMDFTVNGGNVSESSAVQGAKQRQQSMHTVAENEEGTGFTFDVHVSDQKNAHASSVVGIKVLNNGLYQFTANLWLSQDVKLPRDIVVDVHSTVKPEENNYPFSASREELKSAAQRTVQDYVEANLVTAARDDEKKKYKRVLKNSPKLRGTTVKLIDVSDSIPTEDMQKFKNDELLISIGKSTGKAFKSLKNALVKIGNLSDDVDLAGISIGSEFEYAGVHINSSYLDTANSQVLISPIAIFKYFARTSADLFNTQGIEAVHTLLASHIVATLVHELAHNTTSGHEQNYASTLTDYVGHTIGLQNLMVKAISRQLKGFSYERILDTVRGITAYSDRGNIFGEIASGKSVTPSGEEGSTPSVESTGEESERGLGEDRTIPLERAEMEENIHETASIDTLIDDAKHGSVQATRELLSRADMSVGDLHKAMAEFDEDLGESSKRNRKKKKTVKARRHKTNFEKSMKPRDLARIRAYAGSHDAYVQVVNQMERLGVNPTNDGMRKAAIRVAKSLAWNAGKGHKNISDVANAVYAMAEYDSRNGSLTMRYWRKLQALSKSAENESGQAISQLFRDAGVSTWWLNRNKDSANRIAAYLHEEDDGERDKLAKDMSTREKEAAAAIAKHLDTYTAGKVRSFRFKMWMYTYNKYAADLQRIYQKEPRERTKTDKALITRANKALKKVIPKDLQKLVEVKGKDTDLTSDEVLMTILQDGLAAREQGESTYREWIASQNWGTRRNYYSSALLETGYETELAELTVNNDIELRDTEKDNVSIFEPRQMRTRKGKTSTDTRPLASVIIQHTSRVALADAIFDDLMDFQHEVNRSKAERADRAIFKNFTRTLKGFSEPSTRTEKAIRKGAAWWWRIHFATPAKLMWLGLRQIGQMPTFGPSQVGYINFIKHTMQSGLAKTLSSDPTWNAFVAKNYESVLSQKSDIFRSIILADTGIQNEAGFVATQVLDRMGAAYGYFDDINRKWIGSIAFRMARVNLEKYKEGKMSLDKLMSKLKASKLHETEQALLLSRISNEQYDDFLLDYTAMQVEHTNFMYRTSQRSSIEQSWKGRLMAGPVTFLKGTYDILYQNGFKPMKRGFINKDPEEIKKGFSTLVSFLLSSLLSGYTYRKFVGRDAYDPFSLTLTNLRGGAPGLRMLYDTLEGVGDFVDRMVNSKDKGSQLAKEIVGGVASGADWLVTLACIDNWINYYEVAHNRKHVTAARFARKELVKFGRKEHYTYPKENRTNWENVAHFFWGGFEDSERNKKKHERDYYDKTIDYFTK